MSGAVKIRRVTPADAAAWRTMRHALWPDESDDHAAEVAKYLRGELSMPLEVLLAVDEHDRPIGFVELFIRSYAEGCKTNRVGFLEGWYVEKPWRRKGVGAALMRASEDWARAQGCTEFASDAVLDNSVSHAAHRALGFEEVVRLVAFKKDL